MSDVRHLLAADLDAAAADLAAADLAAAFVDDPMMRWVAAEADDVRRLERTATGFFRPALDVGRRRGHAYRAPGGAAVWTAPDVPMFTEADGAELGAALVAALGADAAARLGSIGELVRAHHPHDRPHFYLLLLGAAVQGTGLGARLLAPVLSTCDAEGVPAYLESSNPRNVRFYERQGFTVAWEGRPEPGGPLLQGMWRKPRR